MKRTIRVGIVQQACTNDLKLNLEKLHRNIASVAQAGAQLVVLQELHNTPYFCQTNGIQFWGNSFVAGPQGEIIAQASNLKEENMVVEIDMNRSENVRRWWPFLRDRRIDEFEQLTRRFID